MSPRPELDRREPPRRLANLRDVAPCRYCGHERPAPHHTRDPGDVSVETALEHGYCPELARRRGGLATATT